MASRAPSLPATSIAERHWLGQSEVELAAAGGCRWRRAGGVPGGCVDDRLGRWPGNGPLGQRVGRVHNNERPLPWPAARVTPSGVLVGPVPDGLGGHEPLERTPLFSGRPPSSPRLERVVGGPPAPRRRGRPGSGGLL